MPIKRFFDNSELRAHEVPTNPEDKTDNGRVHVGHFVKHRSPGLCYNISHLCLGLADLGGYANGRDGFWPPWALPCCLVSRPSRRYT